MADARTVAAARWGTLGRGALRHAGAGRAGAADREKGVVVHASGNGEAVGRAGPR